MAPGDHIAFYGTLMSEAPPLPGAPSLSGLVTVVGPCVLAGTLHDLGSYPALAPGEGRVAGELCRIVSPDALAILDVWEDYVADDEDGSEYVRRRVTLLQPAGTAWTYEFNRPQARLPVIDGGDWIAHVRDRGVAEGAARRS